MHNQRTVKILFSTLLLCFCTTSASGQVTSVNGRLGDVTINAADVNGVGNLNLTGRIGLGVAKPKAHFHTTDNPGPGENVSLFRFDLPGLPGEAAWEHTLLHVNGPPTGFRDYSIYSYGYNMTREKPTEPLLGYRFEIDYEPNPGQRWMEHYLEYISDGFVLRPWGFVFDRGTNRVVEASWKSQKFIWTDDRENQVMLGFAGEFGSWFTWGSPTNPTSFLFDRNDWPIQQQRNAAGTGYLSLPFFDSADNLRLGDVANGIHLKANTGLNVDGPDSGYRFLLQSSNLGQAALGIKAAYNGTQTAPYIVMFAPSGHSLFQFLPNGHFVSGSGVESPDVGLLSTTTNTYKITNGNTGYGQIDVAAVNVNAVKVVGTQCAAIPNSTDREDDTRAINEVLKCLRSHGLVAQ